MAETEQITILRLKTEGAESVQDLRDNIKVLKHVVDQAKVGTEEYQDALNLLRVNQNVLKDAMYATSASMDDVRQSATGASESYNSLVHRMAALKEEFRSTNDEVRRSELGAQIKEVNDRLKEMDALQGNFQRNVGNYTESIKGAFQELAENTDTFSKSLNIAGGGINGFKDGFEAFGKSPGVATFGLLVSVAMKLAEQLKDNETAMASLKTAMASLKPVMDFLSGIVEKLAGVLADVIGKVAEFVSSSGLIDKVIKGVMGVGNAILQYVVSPFKGVIAAIKVFKEQGIKGIGDAARAFGQEMKSGFSFKQNFQAGQTAADTITAGIKSKKKDVKDTGKEVAKDLKDGLKEGLDDLAAEIDKQVEADLAAWEKAEDNAIKNAKKKEEQRLSLLDKAYSHQLEMNEILNEDEEDKAAKAYAIQAEANRKRLDLLSQYAQDAIDRGDIDTYLAYEQERADLEVEIETDALREKKRLRDQDKKDAEENVKAQKELLQGVAASTSDILGTIADLYEEDEKNAAKNAAKIKALRIASATIDTLSGAIGAYMQSVASIPPPAGAIVGAIQAAAVTAAGIAQIAQIKNTQISGAADAASVPAIAAAPAITTQVSNVRSVTSASEEDRLNQMASEQRVYILSSDIEASQNQIKTQVSESSF